MHRALLLAPSVAVQDPTFAPTMRQLLDLSPHLSTGAAGIASRKKLDLTPSGVQLDPRDSAGCVRLFIAVEDATGLLQATAQTAPLHENAESDTDEWLDDRVDRRSRRVKRERRNGVDDEIGGIVLHDDWDRHVDGVNKYRLEQPRADALAPADKNRMLAGRDRGVLRKCHVSRRFLWDFCGGALSLLSICHSVILGRYGGSHEGFASNQIWLTGV